MNKKGQRTPVAISDIYSYIVFAMGMVLVIGLFGIRSCVSEDVHAELVSRDMVDVDAHITTINLLSTPVVFNSGSKLEKGTIGDLIVMYKSDKEYRSELAKQLGLVLEKRYSRCVLFCIDDETFAYNDCTVFSTTCSNKLSPLSYTIPSGAGDKIWVKFENYPFDYWEAGVEVAETSARMSIFMHNPGLYIALTTLEDYYE